MGVNVLLIGNGAREHALAWKLQQSSKVSEIFVTPGNAGTALVGKNIAVSADDIDGLVDVARDNNVGIVVVGPEAPLADGVVNRFQSIDMPIFGPTKSAARLESSKSFARDLMKRCHVPTPYYQVVDSYVDGEKYVFDHPGPIVVKADGLSRGKGAIVCMDSQEALRALRLCMVEKAFGSAGEIVVLEEYLDGREISAFSFVDGTNFSQPISACDYKRVGDGDIGVNTGGMGSYSPPNVWNPQLMRLVSDQVMRPVIDAMRTQGNPFVGVLYAGLMLTKDGPKVLEFNCRLGDPEAQVILPLMETDLIDVVTSCIEGNIDKQTIRWGTESCIGVVAASGGYPDEYQEGCIIEVGDIQDDVQVFYGGTDINEDGDLVTSGGRVLTVVAKSNNLVDASNIVYNNLKQITFDRMYYRNDIGIITR